MSLESRRLTCSSKEEPPRKATDQSTRPVETFLSSPLLLFMSRVALGRQRAQTLALRIYELFTFLSSFRFLVTNVDLVRTLLPIYGIE